MDIVCADVLRSQVVRHLEHKLVRPADEILGGAIPEV